jgi:hypothetical protein
LAAVAASSAAELASRGVLSHRTLGSPSALERYRARGGSGRRVGEVIGAAATLAAVWQGWRGSASHAEALDATGWRQYGIACAALPDGRFVFVLLLSNAVLAEVWYEVGWAAAIVHARLLSDIPARADGPGLRFFGMRPPEAEVTVAWDPAPPRVRFEVLFDGRPLSLLVGPTQPVPGAVPAYTDRVLVTANALLLPP